MASMGPPEHWHLRPRPRSRPWRLIALVAAALFAFAFVGVWCRSGGGSTTKASTSASECTSRAACSPRTASPGYGSDSPPPAVRGHAATGHEASCAAPLYAKNVDAELRPASLTKMMTALVAVQRANLTQVFDI